jgi:thiol-disulfide isomerase/thioredoxin
MLSEQQEFDTPPPASGRFWLFLWAALLFGLVIAVVLSRQFGRGHALSPPNPDVGQKFERLHLEPLTGTDQPLSLDDLAGKVALINVWGTWCGPCVIEFPHLQELADHYQTEADFRFVSVSSSGGPGPDDADLAANTEAFMKEQQADFPTYADPRRETRNEIARVAGERGVPFPTTLILGRDGKVRALWFGYRDGLTTEMRDVIDAALHEKIGQQAVSVNP